MSTVLVKLIQNTKIIVKENNILQAGRFLLELVDLADDVVVTNVVSIAPPEPRKGSKVKSKLKYLIQNTP